VIAYGHEGGPVELGDEVLERFRRHRQTRWWRREAGGQLFARFGPGRLLVASATGPRPGDGRWRLAYRPDRAAEQREIDAMFARGLHYVGDWHTHPEDVPRPSPTDLDSIAECARRSRHELSGLLLVVVGRADPPRGLHVGLHDGRAARILSPLSHHEPAPTR
jgi:integrative and conjugative element protein (TIGR02256 family)